MPFVNAVMIPRPTLSNVPVAEESVLGSTQNFEVVDASTNFPINDSDNDWFNEGGSDERQVKEKSRDKKKNKLSRRSFTFGEKEV
jgi:hypothetical protein